VLLIIGSIILTYFAFSELGGWEGLISGLEGMKDHSIVNGQTPDEILSMVRPASDEYMPWTGLLIGVPILGFYFWATNQFMVQRVLGAKDLNHGRWGALFAGLLKLPVIFIMVLPGLAALVLYNDLDISFLNYYTQGDAGPELCTNLADCPNQTYPVLLFKLLPTGMLGLVLASLLAAMMSSASATFNSASTLITMDFITKFRPNMTNDQIVRTGQIATAVLVVLAAAWAPQIENFGSLFAYLQRVIAYTCPPVVAVFILGLFWKRGNGNGAIAGLLSGFAVAIFLLVLEASAEEGVIGGDPNSLMTAMNQIHFLHKAGILLVICAAIQIGVSLATPPQKPEEIQDYVWTPEVFKEDTESLKGLPWYQNYRILSILLLVVTVIVVGMFI
ncbi:MAG: sodium/solute symporter, partial [Bacteroidota bacterium]